MDAKTLDAVLLAVGEAARWVTVEVDERGSSLKGLQGYVGGLVEVVSLGGDVDMWANEEGLIFAGEGREGFGVNLPATLLAVEANDWWPFIMGPCLLTGCTREGETVSLPREFGDSVVERFGPRVGAQAAG